jgi:hypothetical protein
MALSAHPILLPPKHSFLTRVVLLCNQPSTWLPPFPRSLRMLTSPKRSLEWRKRTLELASSFANKEASLWVYHAPMNQTHEGLSCQYNLAVLSLRSRLLLFTPVLKSGINSLSSRSKIAIPVFLSRRSELVSAPAAPVQRQKRRGVIPLDLRQMLTH